MDPDIRQQLVRPFLHATAVPDKLFASGCQLFLTAIHHHPSLQGVLLTGDSLQSADDTLKVTPQSLALKLGLADFVSRVSGKY